MIFTTPLMLLGLLALPVLAAVYWLRSRSRRAVVSSLVFWIDQRAPRRGGRILHRMQTPLSFFLELLAIAMLVAAAAGPALLKRDVVRPLVVVLDDSYSMLASESAKEPNRSRDQAQAAVLGELGRNNYVARFVVAGAQPRLIGEPLSEPARAEAILKQWTCQDSTANLLAAMTLAAEVGGPTARILVVSDHPPIVPLDSGQTEWRAFGRNVANLAFTAATRTRSGENERVLLEVANLSDVTAAGTLTLEGGNLADARKSAVQLAGGAVRQFILDLPAGSPPLQAMLDDDVLAIDNRVLLLPESEKPLRVLVRLADPPLRDAVSRALKATGQVIEVAHRPELIICDVPGPDDGDAWLLEIRGGEDAVAYAGPFVVDHNHVLTEGLSLHDAIWSASPKTSIGGMPIVTAGNVPLLTEKEDRDGGRRLQMAFVPTLSNLQDTPDWPILFTNLVRWRRGGLPGIATPNVRLGQIVAVALAEETDRAAVITPSKTRRELNVRRRRLAVPAEQVGLHHIKTPQIEYQFSCNAVSRDESDLGTCETGQWGSWDDAETYQDRRVGLGWIFLLVALAAMTTHAAVISAETKNTNTQ